MRQVVMHESWSAFTTARRAQIHMTAKKSHEGILHTAALGGKFKSTKLRVPSGIEALDAYCLLAASSICGSSTSAPSIAT